VAGLAAPGKVVEVPNPTRLQTTSAISEDLFVSFGFVCIGPSLAGAPYFHQEMFQNLTEPQFSQ
jgi:hypothetical protein